MALVNQKEKSKRLEEKLTEIRRQEEENRAKKLAEKLNLPYIDLTIAPIDPNDLALLPEKKAIKGSLLVIQKTVRLLRIAVKNPNDPQTVQIIEELKKQGFECQLFITSLTGLKKGWQQYQLIAHPYKDVPLRGVFIIQKKELEEFKKSLKTIEEFKKTISDLSTTRLLTVCMAGAIQMNASDIHLEPAKDKIRFRYRIDGLLQDVTDLPNKEYPFLLSRIKTLSEMFLNVHDISQDGRFSIRIIDDKKTVQTVDIRVSVLPSGYGEAIVMRLLGVSETKLNLNDLGIRPKLFKAIEKQINQPNGMILTTGPTGAGKTTSLYACLNFINEPGKKIITVENPIEYKLEGIIQTQISQRKGHTFASALRAIVRQDPDVLMIGEIRDEESANIAVQFALTGHMVFSTLHTNDAVGAVPRLIGMAIDSPSLSAALNLVIAQRLIRKLCPHCKTTYRPNKEIIEITTKILSLISPEIGLDIPKKITTFYKAKGCPKCHGIGYQGRVGIFEFLIITEEIKKLIQKGAAAFEIQAKAEEEGMIILIQDALLKLVEGTTSLEEVERIVGSPQLIAKQMEL